jgi:hypothetical protein
MRRVVLLAVTGLLALPVAADAAPCYCGSFARWFSSDTRIGHAMRVTWEQETFAAAPIVGQARIDRTRRRVTRYQNWDSEEEKKWCRRNPKVCRAAKACVIAASGTLAVAAVDGKWTRTEFKQATAACAAAALTSLVFP